jgi:hypothetical protein
MEVTMKITDIWGVILYTSILEEPTSIFRVRKGKVIPIQAAEALRVARGRGSHIFSR